MATDNPARVTAAEAVDGAACPKCGASQGAPCVYLPFNVGPQGPRPRTLRTPLYLRVGTPMPGVHPDRRKVVRGRRLRVAVKREARLQRKPDEVMLITRALRDFDLAEYQQLREWLRLHGHLLRNAGKEEG